MYLDLVNNTTKDAYKIAELTAFEDSRMFYHIQFKVGDAVLYKGASDTLVDGTYTYRLYDDDDTQLAIGICQVGDYVAEDSQYDNNDDMVIKYYE